MNTCGILGDYAVLVGLLLTEAGDGEVVLCDGGVVALQPSVVIPLIGAVDLPLHHVANNFAAAVVERDRPAEGR